MEYINIINDNSNVIINDQFRNLSFIGSWDTAWQKAFIPHVFNNRNQDLTAHERNVLGTWHKVSKNHTELVFIAPNGGNAFNKVFSQTNTRDSSILFSPCEVEDFVVYDPVHPDGHGNGNGPFRKDYNIGNTHSFKILRFGERFPSGRYGVEVYNANGAMIFTSNNRYLKIKDFIFIPNFLRQFFEVFNGRTRPKVNINGVISSYRYSGEDWYNGTHCHFKRYRYNEPIAICALNLPSPDIMLQGTTRNRFSNGHTYLSFADEYTFDVMGELGNVYYAYESDTTGEGETGYKPQPYVHEKRNYRGNCDTLALMVIAKNDYL